MQPTRADDFEDWVLCPRYHAKTRTRIRGDMVLKNFPLYCPKCKGIFLIDAENRIIKNQSEPDA